MVSRFYFIIFLNVVLVKISLYIFFGYYGHEFFGGGNDADYYNAYALGETDTALITNYWPVVLRGLNELGLYSRSGLSFVFLTFNIIVLPFLTASISIIDGNRTRIRLFWFIAVVVSIYPTLFYYSLDIYRDILMILVFLLIILVIKKLNYSNRLPRKLILFIAAIILVVILYFLRPYLCAAVLFSILGYRFYSFKKHNLILSSLCYLVALNIFYAAGLFLPIIEYRMSFDAKAGGTNIGILFQSNAMFIPDFVRSFVAQMFGLHITGISSTLVLIVESLPFVIALTYLCKNRKYANKLVDFLLVFFVAYSTVWLLGNDNLGTAVRLRMHSYISIFIACMIVYQKKTFKTSRNRFL